MALLGPGTQIEGKIFLRARKALALGREISLTFFLHTVNDRKSTPD